MHRAELTTAHQAQVPGTLELRGSTLSDNESGLGLQPVVYISAHDTPQFAIPIASSVDRFFDLYSRYLERMVADFEYIETGFSLVTFPWDMEDLIRRDEPLIAQVRAGRFDFLTNDYVGARKWLNELLSPP